MTQIRNHLPLLKRRHDYGLPQEIEEADESDDGKDGGGVEENAEVDVCAGFGSFL